MTYKLHWSSAGGFFVMRSLNPYPENFDQIVVVLDWGGGGGKLPNANGPNLPTANSFWGGGGAELPNANGPNLPTVNSFLGGGGVNYQTQMVQTY